MGAAVNGSNLVIGLLPGSPEVVCIVMDCGKLDPDRLKVISVERAVDQIVLERVSITPIPADVNMPGVAFCLHMGRGRQFCRPLTGGKIDVYVVDEQSVFGAVGSALHEYEAAEAHGIELAKRCARELVQRYLCLEPLAGRNIGQQVCQLQRCGKSSPGVG